MKAGFAKTALGEVKIVFYPEDDLDEIIMMNMLKETKKGTSLVLKEVPRPEPEDTGFPVFTLALASRR